MSEPINQAPSSFNPTLTLGLCALFVGVIGRSLRWWSAFGPALLPAGRYSLMVGTILCVAGLAIAFKRKQKSLDSRILLLSLLLLSLTDWFGRPYTFFPADSMRGELLLFFILAFFIIQKRKWDLAVAASLGISIVGLFYAFSEASQGRLLFSDDHATFFFRLSLLKENFPSIPFWYPLWNGGIDARDFFATGALNFFFFSLPFIYGSTSALAYNLAVTSILFILVPGLIGLAAKISGYSWKICVVAAILSLSTSLFWYRWTLAYGTMGFAIACILVPLNVELVARYVEPQTKFSWATMICMVVSVTLMTLWSPSGLVFIPFSALALQKIPQIIKSKQRVTSALLLMLINIPWLILFVKVSSVGSFIDKTPQHSRLETTRSSNVVSNAEVPSPTPLKRTISLKKKFFVAGAKLQESLQAMNPLLLFLCIPALLSARSYRKKYYLISVGWLALLGAVGPLIVPQLELDRMIVVMGFVLTIPVASFIVHFLEQPSFNTLTSFSQIICGGFLLASPLSAYAIISNRTLTQYHFASDVVPQMSTALKTFSRGGRALFSGCVVHQLSDGHLAPLTLFSGVSLIASSHVHNLWWYTQIFPKSFLERRDEGIQDYLNVMNVSVVLAHEPYWRDYFKKNNSFREVWRGGQFVMFDRTNFSPNYFFQGEGSLLSQTSHSIEILPQTSEVVIKFLYYPFLKSSSCHIEPYQVAPEVTLIKLSQCVPNIPVTLESISPVQRMTLSTRHE